MSEDLDKEIDLVTSHPKPGPVSYKKKEDFTEKIDAPVALKDDVRASGVCGKCRKRYTAVPVINGVPQCPICDKV